MKKKTENISKEPDNEPREYEFTVIMSGWGETPEEAWKSASEGVLEDPDGFCSESDLPDYKILEGE